MTEWSRVKHFRREEFKLDPDRISPDVVYLLDECRDDAPAYLGGDVVFSVNVAFDTGGHKEDSSHYAPAGGFATAVDFSMSRRIQPAGASMKPAREPVPLVDQWLFMERYPWLGIGLYPSWKVPGLHVDLRRIGRDHSNLGRRWWRDAEGKYQSLDKQFLKTVLLV